MKISAWQAISMQPTMITHGNIDLSSRLSPAAQIICPAILDTARVQCNFNHLPRLLCWQHDKSCVQRRSRDNRQWSVVDVKSKPILESFQLRCKREINGLTGRIEADLAVHVDVQRILCLSDGCKQSLLLAEQVQQELSNAGDLLVILRIRSSNYRLIFGFCHDLVAQIGVFHLCDIGITVQDLLCFIHKGLELILITECFFQIHFHQLVILISLCSNYKVLCIGRHKTCSSLVPFRHIGREHDFSFLCRLDP